MYGVTIKIMMNPWNDRLHNSKAVANYSQLVPCYIKTSGATKALFQDFPVGDWEACATEFWKASPLASIPILQCFPTSFQSLITKEECPGKRNRSKYPLVKAPPMGQSHVTKPQLMPHSPVAGG